MLPNRNYFSTNASNCNGTLTNCCRIKQLSPEGVGVFQGINSFYAIIRQAKKVFLVENSIHGIATILNIKHV